MALEKRAISRRQSVKNFKRMEKVIGSIYQAITSTRRNQKTALGLQRKLLELFAVAAAVAASQYTYMLEGKTITVADYQGEEL